jgi:hypothetical protein
MAADSNSAPPIADKTEILIMAEFTFSKATNPYNAVKFLAALVGGQNTATLADTEKTNLVTGATIQWTKDGVVGTVTYEGPQAGRMDFRHKVRNDAAFCGNVEIQFGQ